jgi:hypothetical protein
MKLFFLFAFSEYSKRANIILLQLGVKNIMNVKRISLLFSLYIVKIFWYLEKNSGFCLLR